MKKLKIKLWRIENVVLMKVLEQDESLRGKYRIFNNEEITIHSELVSDMQGLDIWISGTRKDLDGRVVFREFETINEAKTYYNKVKKVVQDYNKTLDTDESEEESEVVE